MVNGKDSLEGGRYHIRVQGTLDGKWAEWFEGFAMTSRDDGETLLTGCVVDQAALHGVLAKIRGLGLPLQALLRVDCPCTCKRCPRHGDCRQCAAHYQDDRGMPYCFRRGTRWDRQCGRMVGGDAHGDCPVQVPHQAARERERIRKE